MTTLRPVASGRWLPAIAAKADGRKLGAPRRLSEEQEAAVIELVGSGARQRGVARSFGISPATVRRAVKRE